ncbi:UAA transporter [Serendipita vermifera]|nr:UAA transporter [Serendipita vermifera]
MSVKSEKNSSKSSNGATIIRKDTIDDVSYPITLVLVFGGCCSNAWTLEKLLMHDSSIGSALTFLQLSFVVLYSIPGFLHFRQDVTIFKYFPRIESPVVPLKTWGVQVIVLLAVNILNNWTFFYKIPLTVQIIFRSSGLAVSMLFGYLFLDRRYSYQQLIAVILVTCGVITATLSRPNSVSSSAIDQSLSNYFKGLAAMASSLLMGGVLGLLQERTYQEYGPHWKEGLFYTHMFALPLFLLVTNDVASGLSTLTNRAKQSNHIVPQLYIDVVLNIITQASCVAGANRLVSTSSSVKTSLLLTARKAVSLIISIVWFGNGWTVSLFVGGGLVAIGTLLYNWPVQKEKKDKTD